MASAEALAQLLSQKYGITDNSLSTTLQLEIFKIVTDYSQFMFNAKENIELTEYEMLLIKHKNRQAFLSAFCQRTGQDVKVGEKFYDKIRQKLS